MIQKNRIWTVEKEVNGVDVLKIKEDEKQKDENNLKCPRFWILDSIRNYCSTTALHGYNYIVRDDTTRGEKTAWITIVIVALITAVVLLWISWNWNEETPTVTVIESTHFATWNIPFPAVTICNFNKISKDAALKLAEKFKKPENVTTEDLMDMFRLALDFSGANTAKEIEYLEVYRILNANNYNAPMLLRDLSPSCSDMLQRCMWKGTQTRCDTLFQPINSSEGICCSFNYHGLSTNNYPIKLAYSVPGQPRRVTACGYQTGLSVLLKPMVKDYFATHLSSAGFRVLIHDSYDFPDDNAETKVITSNTEAFISVSPESTYATLDVRGLKPSIRNCLFFDEKKLSLMQHYTYSNCLAECRSTFVFKTCGCVPPNFPNNGSLPECKMNKIYCVVSNRKLFTGSLPGMNTTIVREGNYVKTPCGCLPDCELLQYPAEITSGVLNRDFAFNMMNFFKDVTLEDETLVHIYFNDLVSTRYRKDIYQNWLAVLASFGGLLGLILGFSIVTAFEFIYYLTLRPIFDRFSM